MIRTEPRPTSAALLAALIAVPLAAAPAGASTSAALDSAALGLAIRADDPTAAAAFGARRGLRADKGVGGLEWWLLVVEAADGRAASIDSGALEASGARIDAISRSYIRIAVPAAQIPKIADIPNVGLVRAPARGIPIGDPQTTAESVAAVGADRWHDDGLTGSGVRVAVVDLGFDGFSEAVDRGELPAHTVTRDFTNRGLEGGTPHGVAVAEVLVDIAPDIELFVVRVIDEVDLENAADYLFAEGVRIANHSVGWLAQSYYDGTGSISGVIDRSRFIHRVLWTVAAGNRPDLDADGVSAHLLATALDLGPEGPDTAYGHGRVAMPGRDEPLTWVAYDDLNPLTTGEGARPGVTTFTCLDAAGAMLDFETGAPLPVTMSGVVFGDYEPQLTGRAADGGTPADALFGGIVDLEGVDVLRAPDQGCEISFDGLAPASRYDIALTANRGNHAYDFARFTRVTLSGAAAMEPLHSAGVVAVAPDTAALGVGNNTERGDVVRWTHVAVPEGRLIVRFAWDPTLGAGGANTRSYGIGAIRLERLPIEDGPSPGPGAP